MRYLTVFLLLHCAIAPLALSQDLVIIDRPSPGLVPAMKASYVSRYNGDLQFLADLLHYPLLNGTPSAVLMVGEALVVGENTCAGAVCVPRVVRHDPSGTSVVFEPALSSAARSIRLSPRGDLVVASSEEIVRFDRFSGVALVTYVVPHSESSSVHAADIDDSGCTIAVTLFPNIIALGDICGPAPAWTSFTVVLPDGPPYGICGLSFLPDGTLLIGARNVYQLDRAGNVIRAYDTGLRTTCIRLDRIGQSAFLGGDWDLLRLDLESGERFGPVQIRHGIAVGSIAVVEPQPVLRRRAIRH